MVHSCAMTSSCAGIDGHRPAALWMTFRRALHSADGHRAGSRFQAGSLAARAVSQYIRRNMSAAVPRGSPPREAHLVDDREPRGQGGARPSGWEKMYFTLGVRANLSSSASGRRPDWCASDSPADCRAAATNAQRRLAKDRVEILMAYNPWQLLVQRKVLNLKGYHRCALARARQW